MNKRELLAEISTMSEVDTVDCEKVIDALEKILQREFSSSGLSGAFEKFCRLIKMFKIKMI